MQRFGDAIGQGTVITHSLLAYKILDPRPTERTPSDWFRGITLRTELTICGVQ